MITHKYSSIIIIGFSSLFSVSSAYACADHRGGRQEIPIPPSAPHLSSCQQQSRTVTSPPVVSSLQCGQVITSSVTLNADLDCPSTTGFALIVEGNGVVVNGRGHKIVAPNALAGIYVQGTNDTIENFVINGISEGSAIDAYDSPGITVVQNNVSGNQTGILLYAENTSMTNISVIGNEASGNSLFGLRTGWDTNGSIQSPVIQENDFSQSGSYGMYVMAQNYELTGFSFNSVRGSVNGYYLAHGDFFIHDLEMPNEFVQNLQIFVDTASSVTVNNVDVSTLLKPLATQEHVGLDLYRCSQFNINGLSGWNNDAPLKLETEEGTSPQGIVNQCNFRDNTVAGVLIVSYDGTPYGKVIIEQTEAQENAPAVDLLLAQNTVLGAGSSVQFNSFSNYPGNNQGNCNRNY